MKFAVRSVCKKCGREFTTYKRYDPFCGIWELDSDKCEDCYLQMKEKISTKLSYLNSHGSNSYV